eukprot:jgi/Chlat1/8411/Chrsp80S07914
MPYVPPYSCSSATAVQVKKAAATWRRRELESFDSLRVCLPTMPLSSPSADPQFAELLDRIGPGILAYLLESPVWTGGGPGMMQAVSQMQY